MVRHFDMKLCIYEESWCNKYVLCRSRNGCPMSKTCRNMPVFSHGTVGIPLAMQSSGKVFQAISLKCDIFECGHLAWFRMDEHSS